jgi:hypothetical protein
MILRTAFDHDRFIEQATCWSRTLFLSTLISLFWLNLLSSVRAASNESPDPTKEAAGAPAAPPETKETTDETSFRMIGATTTVVEASTGFFFPARVDTGATCCSIHYEALEIKDAASKPEDNVGKSIRILIKNPAGQEEWIKTKIAGRVVIRTAERKDERYKVPLKLRLQDVEKKVLVTLNDREKMKYPLLIGRNFLRGDFLVDVDLDGDE